MTVTINGTTGLAGTNGSAGTPAVQGEDTNTGVFFPAADTVAVATNGSERLRVDSAGSVGIGVTSMTAPLEVRSVSPTNNAINFVGNGAAGASTVNFFSADKATRHAFIYGDNTSLQFGTNNTERARIDALGNMRLTTNTAYLEVAPNGTWSRGIRFGGNGNVSDATYANICTTNGNIHIDPTTGSFATYLNWYSGTGGVHVGNATASGYGQIRASAFTTISDYRLKENVTPLSGAADRLAQIPVHRFNFIADPDKTVDGFLAHEVQDVVPEAVVGTKDEVDADGNPTYQGIDQSKLVPLLTAALQEALTKITALEARIAALEGV